MSKKPKRTITYKSKTDGISNIVLARTYVMLPDIWTKPMGVLGLPD